MTSFYDVLQINLPFELLYKIANESKPGMPNLISFYEHNKVRDTSPALPATVIRLLLQEEQAGAGSLARTENTRERERERVSE